MAFYASNLKSNFLDAIQLMVAIYNLMVEAVLLHFISGIYSNKAKRLEKEVEDVKFFMIKVLKKIEEIKKRLAFIVNQLGNFQTYWNSCKVQLEAF
ncbi:42052_t:CDS:2 [Gigaspora margarita]|uniref:42052_t:CDS:1 n=1 Tax=Gigaspora margarita TaxID=4874 RepID=A0ABM8VYF2_GIGMA|nr:42052_t:CDS:2 [Gigaspora margarita]